LAFSEEEKERIRYHLGYLNVGAAASLQFGLPAPIQMLFIVESAMEKVLPVGEDRIRSHISFMDKIECAMMEGIDYLPANRLGDMELRKTHLHDLEDEYYRWANRLAGQLGVPLYLYAEKFQAARGRRGGMIPRE
jgi:hypothetical protein